MYTALSLGVQFRRDTPSDVIDTIEYMVTGRREMAADEYAARAMHPLFSTPRWTALLRCDSYYFDWQTRFGLTYDGISKSWYLTGVSNLKNYSNEINLFLDWIQPHIETPGYIGWKMYEEDVCPTLLFNDLGRCRIFEKLPTRSEETLMEGLTPINAETWQ
jgi:hypothetical protein